MAAGQKAYLETERKERIPCLFNPAELQLGLANSWDADTKPGQQAPSLQYRGGESGTLGLELMFDTTGAGTAVTEHTNKLVKLMQVDTRLPGYAERKQNGRPGWVKFHWGSFHSFRCVIASLNVTFTYFASNGTPLRAKVSLSLKQYMPERSWPAQNPTSGTPAPAAAHVLQPGETLDRLAARYYGDPFGWRPIAEANGISDPFSLRPGVVLDIPRQEV